MINKAFKKVVMLILTLVIFILILTHYSINIVDSEKNSVIFENNIFKVIEAEEGLLEVHYNLDDYGVILVKNESKDNSTEYKYIMKKGYEIITLTDGKGTYNITLHNVKAISEYKSEIVNTYDNIKVNLSEINQNNVFYKCTTLVDFESNIEQINNIFKETDDIEEIYVYFTNIEYDRSLADRITSGEVKEYKADISKVLETRKGICFDIATAMTAVLRSKGYCTQMVYGYVNTQYHSWVRVLVDGEWVSFDPTIGKTSYENDMSNYKIVEYH